MIDTRSPAGKESEGASEPSEQELAQRLARLEKSLEAQRPKEQKRRTAGSEANAYGQAFRLSAEFVAGIGVGAALGWGIDRWFETSPLGLIVFLLLGFAAGVLNVLRAAGLAPEPGSASGQDGQQSSEQKRSGNEK
ncbi:MAG: hypothetical protein C0606_16070 [Hyphomicrobiales bacterium]|nr:MAG: hypothetical protein C0606_16070 [Hyphomicrobiales bacterium]